MDRTVLSALMQSIRALTTDMLIAAREGRWEALAGLQQQRYQLVDDLKKQGPLSSTQAPDAVRDWLTDLLATDVEVIGLSRARMDELGSGLQRLQVEKNVRKAYGAL